jgi:hypothetical protein
MQRSARRRPGRSFLVRAMLSLSLVGAIGLGLASDAAAIDPPAHPRKAAKHGPLSKGKAAVGRTALPKGGAAPSQGAGPRDGAARLHDRAAPGTGLSKSNRPGADRHQPAALAKRSATVPGVGQRGALSKSLTPAQRRLRIDHRRSILIARSRLPHRPFPGERGFTGVPPAGETRFVSNEMVFQVGANVSQQAIDNAARRLGLTTVGSQSFGLTGGTLFHFRVAQGRPVADVVRALEAENIGVAQPNYVFRLQQDTSLAARTRAGDPTQYVVDKLRLGDVHRVATGRNVLVAVIDSEIDLEHPDLEGAIVERFDAVGRRDEPHSHGTAMAGAIVAHRKLMGIAPGARILAVHAFSPESKEGPQATTRHILAGLEWAINKGARVINMSFAGPYDPMLQLAMKKAHEKGIVLIAAAGNMGPKSPPLYPAADPHVIAVTATDESDKLFAQANQGPHVAVAAPGVNILEPAPNATYQLTTGTSVAAAHVSGVAALLIERNPSLDPTAVHEILTLSAKKAGAATRDDQLGWGLIDPAKALVDAEAKVAQDATPATPAAAKPAPPTAGRPASPTAAKPAPVSSR